MFESYAWVDTYTLFHSFLLGVLLFDDAIAREKYEGHVYLFHIPLTKLNTCREIITCYDIIPKHLIFTWTLQATLTINSFIPC